MKASLSAFGWTTLINLCRFRATTVQNGIQAPSLLPSAPQIAEQCKYITAHLFDTKRPSSFIQFILTLLRSLGLDQSI